jgi:uncharacterized RmlC-like cupin family protein
VLDKPLLISPHDKLIGLSCGDQPIATLVDGTNSGAAAGSPVSAGYISMRPGAVDAPYCKPNTWVYMLLWSASPLGSITMYGSALQGMIHQKPGQLLLVPPGIPHATANPSPTHDVIIYKFCANPSIHADNAVCEELRAHLESQMPMLFDIPANQPNR